MQFWVAPDGPGRARGLGRWLLCLALIAIGSAAIELGPPAAAVGADQGLDQIRAQLDQTAFRLSLLEALVADPRGEAQSAGEFRAVAAAVALLNLRHQAQTDRPFTADLALARPLLPTTPRAEEAVTALAAYAAGGVPSIDDLAIEFRRLRPLLQAQVAASADSGGPWRDLLAAIHLSAPHAPDPRLAVLNQIATELERGRLGAAVAAIDGLDPPVQAIASGWRAAARVRLGLDERVEMLVRNALIEVAGAHD